MGDTDGGSRVPRKTRTCRSKQLTQLWKEGEQETPTKNRQASVIKGAVNLLAEGENSS